MSPASKIGIVIVAAGTSARLGKPKQLLEYKGKSLLQHAIDAAVHSKAEPVVLVVGANADAISEKIERSKINVLINTEWEEGMASSIRNGLNELLFISPATDAVILMVCDQPFISSEIINELIDKQKETGKQIVCSNYGETFGTPALFHKFLFDELMQLRGDAGGRKIVRQHPDDMTSIPFAKGMTDIDTGEDYENLKKL